MSEKNIYSLFSGEYFFQMNTINFKRKITSTNYKTSVEYFSKYFLNLNNIILFSKNFQKFSDVNYFYMHLDFFLNLFSLHNINKINYIVAYFKNEYDCFIVLKFKLIIPNIDWFNFIFLLKKNIYKISYIIFFKFQ